MLLASARSAANFRANSSRIAWVAFRLSSIAPSSSLDSTLSIRERVSCIRSWMRTI